MRITESFQMPGSVEAVAAMLSDVNQVAMCVPGVEGIKPAADGTPDSYEADLSVKVGPIKAKFAGSITLDTTDGPGTIRASGRGKDRATNSQVTVGMTAVLTAVGDGTNVAVEADVAIRGRLGQFGLGVIQSTASEITRAFATCLQARMSGDEEGALAARDESLPVGRMVARGIYSSIRGGLRRGDGASAPDAG